MPSAAGLSFEATGSGPPVVLVHAGIADGRMWRQVAPRLAASHRVVVPDLRGFGRSPLPDGPVAHAADLAALARDLTVEKAAWVGCSMGGTAVLDLALEEPELVAAMALVDSIPSGHRITDPAVRAGWAAAEAAYDSGDLRGAAEIEMEMWLIGPTRTREVPDDLCDLVVEMLLASYRHGVGDQEPPARLAVEHLETIGVPTLVVVGEHDQAELGDLAAMMAARIPDARSVVVPGAAHLPPLERPRVFTARLEAFLADVYG